MTDNEKLPEWIDRFTNNELEGEELQQFIGMLRADPDLRKEVKLDHDLNTILLDEDILDLRMKLKDRSGKNKEHRFDSRQLLLAASLLFLAGLALLFYFTCSRHDPEHYTDMNRWVAQDSYKQYYNGFFGGHLKIPLKDSLKENASVPESAYQPFPPFESITGSSMRSDDFSLIEPVQFSFSRREMIRFKCSFRTGIPLVLEITDNRGNNVMKLDPGIQRTCIIGKNRLSPGLYYFKFLAEEEIIYLGKLRIERDH